MTFPMASLTSFLKAIRPSFIDIFSNHEKPAPTAYLDGLRGWASFIVFCYHFMYDYHRWYDAGYGRQGKNHLILQLPFFCLIYAGPAMVALFYVVSGFSLSWGPLKELKAGRVAACHSRLASSTFRRPFRLLLPPMVVSAVVVVCLRLGFYDFSIEHHVGWAVNGSNEPRPPIMPTATAQFTHWVHSVFLTLGNPFYKSPAPDFPYDVHLWTIPAEFRWSLVLFLVVAAISRFRLLPRFLFMIGSLLFSAAVGCWEAVPFMAGLILAHMTLHAEEGQRVLPSEDEAAHSLLETGEINEKVVEPKTWKKYLPYFLFVVALYLMSAPDWGQDKTPGFVLLSYLSPSWWGYDKFRFLHIVGAIFLTYAVSKNSRLEWLFNNPVSKYLGRVSFGLYLSHGPMVHMLGDRLIPTLWKYTNGPVQADEAGPGSKYEGGTPVGYEMGFLLGAGITMLCTFCVADMVTRHVDEPVVRLCKKMEAWLLEP